MGLAVRFPPGLGNPNRMTEEGLSRKEPHTEHHDPVKLFLPYAVDSLDYPTR